MSSHDFRRFFLVALLLFAVDSSAHARERRTSSVSCRMVCISNPAPSAAGSPLVWADVWNFGSFFTGGGRARIVQICVVLMCLALFIMMKKLNG